MEAAAMCIAQEPLFRDLSGFDKNSMPLEWNGTVPMQSTFKGKWDFVYVSLRAEKLRCRKSRLGKTIREIDLTPFCYCQDIDSSTGRKTEKSDALQFVSPGKRVLKNNIECLRVSPEKRGEIGKKLRMLDPRSSLPLIVLLRRRYWPIIKENDKNPKKKALFYASSGNMIQLVSMIEINIVSPSTQIEETKTTLLHGACEFGREEIVKWLLDHHAFYDAADDLGDTPLHVAGRGGHMKCLELLLEAGANIRKKNNNIEYPSDCALGLSAKHLLMNGEMRTRGKKRGYDQEKPETKEGRAMLLEGPPPDGVDEELWKEIIELQRNAAILAEEGGLFKE